MLLFVIIVVVVVAAVVTAYALVSPQRGGRGLWGPESFVRAQSPKPLSTWSPNKNAVFGEMELWSEAMEPYSPEFSVLEP